MDNLCKPCNHLFAGIKWEAERYNTYFHHRDIYALEDAAEDGCVLCRSVLGSLTDEEMVLLNPYNGMPVYDFSAFGEVDKLLDMLKVSRLGPTLRITYSVEKEAYNPGNITFYIPKGSTDSYDQLTSLSKIIYVEELDGNKPRVSSKSPSAKECHR